MMDELMKQRYYTNKSADIGDLCICPSCATDFRKKTYQQCFCKTKGGTICKDKYWNTIDPKKRCNTQRISPASTRWLNKKREERDGRESIEDSMHPLDDYCFGKE